MKPKLRFPGYHEDWQSTLLGDIASFHKGKGISKSDIIIDGIHFCIRYGELYTEYNEVIRNVISKTNQPKEESVISEIGDVLIPASGETAIDMATACALPFNNIILGGDINVIRPKKREYSELIAYSLGNVKKIDLARVAQGNSVVHISGKHLSRIRVELPISDGEITSINRLLYSVDTKIKLLTKKKQALEGYKQGLMQKIFSQELRFKREDGTDYPEWNSLPLESFCEIIRGITYNAENVKPEGGTLVLRSTNIQSGKLDLSEGTKQFIDVIPKSKLILKDKDIIVCMSNGSKRLVGKSAVYNSSAYPSTITAGGFCAILRSKNSLTQYLLQSAKWKRYLHILLAGSSINNLRNNEVGQLRFELPCEEETLAVVGLLKAVDTKIDCTTSQLEESVKMKKGLLQQMFV